MRRDAPIRTFLCRALLTPAQLISPAVLRVADGVVVDVANEAGDAGTELDGTVVPGFVDLQVNGWGKRDVLEGTTDAITSIAKDLLAQGVTAWLPTIVSSREKDRLAALGAAEHPRAHSGRAPGRGVHLEGPWISPVRAGAHPPDLLRPPDEDEIRRSFAAPDLVRLVTLAPELEGGLDAVRQVVADGAVASIGHSDATYEQARAAVDTGVRKATHLFNAMRPLHQREPGVVGAVLTDTRVVAGLIGDGVHVHPSNMALAFRAKPGRIALVSDAVGGPNVRGSEGAARLPDGALMGATRGAGDGVRIAVEADVPLEQVITAATRTPADLLGVPFGRIEAGATADFVVLDGGLRTVATFMGGECVWSS
jgi:N-acetylglucosamine-6-phosphate deacetylase